MDSIPRKKDNSSYSPTSSDVEIFKTLLEQNQLTWTEIFNKTGLSNNTLDKRLKKLVDLGIVTHIIDKKSTPPKRLYAINQSIPSTEKDITLIYESLGTFNHIRKLHELTNQAVGKKTLNNPEASMIQTYYNRLFPYFLWCLYYGSKTESIYGEKTITRFYISRIEEKMLGTVHAFRDKKVLREMIAFCWNDLNERVLRTESVDGEELFVNQFPSQLSYIAKNFFQYYLSIKKNTWSSPLTVYKSIVEDKNVRKEFENQVQAKIPKYITDRFLSLMEKIYS